MRSFKGDEYRYIRWALNHAGIFLRPPPDPIRPALDDAFDSILSADHVEALFAPKFLSWPDPCPALDKIQSFHVHRMFLNNRKYRASDAPHELCDALTPESTRCPRF